MSTLTPTPPAVDIQIALEALAKARRRRSQWLLALNDGRTTWQDLIRAAAHPEGEALRKIALIDILSAQMPAQSAHARLRTLRSRLNVSSGTKDLSLTVGWLLSQRGRPGHRLAVFCDVMAVQHAQRAERVSGFPYAAPEALTKVWN